MDLLYSFLFAGIVCLIAEIILDNSKLTSGHITSLFAVFGSILAFLGIYPNIGISSSILITNFGNCLYLSGMEGYYNNGIIGILSSLLCKSSLVITGTIIISFILTIFFKPKD